MRIPSVALTTSSSAIALVALAGCAAQSAPVAEQVRSTSSSPVMNLAPLCDPGNVFTSLQGARDDDTVTADASSLGLSGCGWVTMLT